jgi:ubiquinone/menaquinone biosynthesis C-methylase UbiE
MRRVDTPELLDSDAGPPEEIRRSLADLRRINRWFGGNSTTTDLIARVARCSRPDLELLDVAAGFGDVPAYAQRRLEQEGIDLRFTLLDRRASHLDSSRVCVSADALELPFRDNAFDLVSCGLFTHHLQPPELIRFVNEGLRVARIAVLINDLLRHPLHLALVYAAWPLFRSPLSRHDGLVSVRRAYTVEELTAMTRQTNSARVEIRRYYLFRIGIIAWR